MVAQRSASGAHQNRKQELRRWYLSGWMMFGILWGAALGHASRIANHNYERIVGAMKAHDAHGAPYYDGFAFHASMLGLTVVLAGLLALYFVIGVLAFARRRSFWLTLFGVIMGISAAGFVGKFM